MKNKINCLLYIILQMITINSKQLSSFKYETIDYYAYYLNVLLLI